MCVCASDSGTADFREGLLADGQSPDTNQHTQSSARARAHHIHSNTAQLCYVGVCVGAWVFCLCARQQMVLSCLPVAMGDNRLIRKMSQTVNDEI